MLSASEQCWGRLAFGIQAPITRGRFRHVSNLCHDDSRVVIWELDARKRERLSLIRGSLLGRTLRPQWCLQMYFDGRSDENEQCGIGGMKPRNKTALTHFLIFFFFSFLVTVFQQLSSHYTLHLISHSNSPSPSSAFCRPLSFHLYGLSTFLPCLRSI